METPKNKPSINRLAKQLIRNEAPAINGGASYEDCYHDGYGWVCRTCGYLWYDICGPWTPKPGGYTPGPFTPHPNPYPRG